MRDFNIKKIKKLKEIISRDALMRKEQQKIVHTDGSESSWLFDFRNIFLKPESLNLIVDIFWDLFNEKYPFQVGGQEIAAIPLTSAIVFKSQQLNKPVNGFIIRKSRKPVGMQKLIEGELNENKII